MKKIMSLMVLLLILAPVVSWAEEGVTAPAQGQGMHMCSCPCCKMCQKGGMMGGKMCPMMGKMMGKASMVASQDGGVIVLVGSKLQKYDADLNLVKEIEIQTPAMEMPMAPEKAAELAPAETAPALTPAVAPEEPATPVFKPETETAEEPKPAEDTASQTI